MSDPNLISPPISEPRNTLVRALNRIETLGNRLPHPTLLFVILCPLVILVSAVASYFNVQAIHPINNSLIQVSNLLSTDGLHKILQHTVTNFTHFAPVGSVLVAMLGIGIAEKSGFIGALLKLVVFSMPNSWITFMVVIAGVLSSLAADAGYVVLIPIAALLFLAAGKHPVAGITAAFAGVSGGYSANLIIGPVDVILAGVSTEAAQLVQPTYQVAATANFYFIAASTVIIGIMGTLVTNKIVIPYLGPYSSDHDAGINSVSSWRAENPKESYDQPRSDLHLSDLEKNSLIKSCSAVVALVILILWGVLPDHGVLRHAETGSITQSPFISGIVMLIALGAALGGIVYGRSSGTFKNNSDVVAAMETSMATMAGYLVLMFFAAQFVNYFNWTNLGAILAISSSSSIKDLNINPTVLVCIFIFLSASINLFVGSASAKWAILAPVFVPMFLLLGIAPELTQAAYRIGDSSTNIITPLMPYFALIVAFIEKYDSKTGIGTVIALMLPYSLFFLLGWTIFIAIWLTLGIPLGPDSSLFIEIK